jgi:hypothetical protein
MATAAAEDVPGPEKGEEDGHGGSGGEQPDEEAARKGGHGGMGGAGPFT